MLRENHTRPLRSEDLLRWMDKDQKQTGLFTSRKAHASLPGIVRRFFTFNNLIALGVVATVLYYLENSRWLPAMLKALLGFEPSFDASLMLRIVIALVIFGLLWDLNSRFKTISQKPPDASSGEDPLKVVARTADLTVVRLGEKEFELGPGAYDYYKQQNEADQEKILRLLRRYIAKLRWTKEEFIMEVDERQRLHIRLDRYMGEGRAIKAAIDNESSQRLVPPPPLGELGSARRGLAAALGPPLLGLGLLPDFKLSQLGTDLQRWQDEVYSFLQKERPGFSEEFRRDVALPEDHRNMDALKLLSHKVGILIERLVEIKRKIPS